MTKNILVTDQNCRIVGTTYPKRARGLIKSGRATKISELMIQLAETVDTPAFSFEMEDIDMANIIDFKARSFKLDDSIKTNKGTRLIVTEGEESVECFELAEGGALTGIVRKVDLEKDQDYAFRFAVKSRFVRADAAECMVSIYFDEPGDGYTYPIDRGDKNRFKPSVCKKTSEGILRVFTLPFNSGDATSATISIRVNNMTTWIYPAKDAEAYSLLEDVDYDQWRNDEVNKIGKVLNDIGGSIGTTLNDIGGTLGDALTGIGDFAVGVGEKVTKAVSDVINHSAGEKAEKCAAEAEKPCEDKEAPVDTAAGEAKEEAKEEVKEDKKTESSDE